MNSHKAKLDFVCTPGFSKHCLLDALMTFTELPSAANYRKLETLIVAYQADYYEVQSAYESLQSLGVL